MHIYAASTPKRCTIDDKFVKATQDYINYGLWLAVVDRDDSSKTYNDMLTYSHMMTVDEAMKEYDKLLWSYPGAKLVVMGKNQRGNPYIVKEVTV